jgi:hypothetical protein
MAIAVTNAMSIVDDPHIQPQERTAFARDVVGLLLLMLLTCCGCGAVVRGIAGALVRPSLPFSSKPFIAGTSVPATVCVGVGTFFVTKPAGIGFVAVAIVTGVPVRSRTGVLVVYAVEVGTADGCATRCGRGAGFGFVGRGVVGFGAVTQMGGATEPMFAIDGAIIGLSVGGGGATGLAGVGWGVGFAVTAVILLPLSALLLLLLLLVVLLLQESGGKRLISQIVD